MDQLKLRKDSKNKATEQLGENFPIGLEKKINLDESLKPC